MNLGLRDAFNGGPHNKDYSILGSILRSPCFGNLPYQRDSRRNRQGHARLLVRIALLLAQNFIEGSGCIDLAAFRGIQLG